MAPPFEAAGGGLGAIRPGALPASDAPSTASRRTLGGAVLLAVDTALALLMALIVTGSAATAMTTAAVTVPLVGLSGGYQRSDHLTLDAFQEARRLAVAGLLTGLASVVAAHNGFAVLTPNQGMVLGALLAIGLLAARTAGRALLAPSVNRVLVIGAGPGAGRLAGLAARHGERRVRVVGCLTSGSTPDTDPGVAVLGPVSRLWLVLARGGIDRVVVDASAIPGADGLWPILRSCRAAGVPVDLLPHLHDLLGPTPRTYHLGATPIIRLQGPEPPRGQRVVKRAVDVVLASAGLVLAAVPCAAIALAIKLSDGGPVLFRQRRIGKDGAAFHLLKFRTMVPGADAIGDRRIARLDDGGMTIADAVAALKAPGDHRVTPLGRILRSTSLDELPQLVHVLRGHMSIVGPRPLRDFEVDRLTGRQRDRQRVKPGLTGLWQVSGRSAVGWDERMTMDHLYARDPSLEADAQILFRTVPALLRRRGAR